ncbi:MAG: hypothetical protein DHS20C10_06250 [marine bacterium B5-7]|nr:MAG: hypothetical protein DHS20C10_06250 [marine bacterium B5-7]
MRLGLYGIILLLAACVTTSAFAKTTHSAEIFASNNTGHIDLPSAYSRLAGRTQQQLNNQLIKIIQKAHLEQGKFDRLLGAYQMASTQTVTADNTAVFMTSPYQALSSQTLFDLAKAAAVALNQESVAVFMPSHQAKVGEIMMTFVGSSPSVDKVIALLHKKLPSFYSEAFSLHLENTCRDYAKATVSSIEWLGARPQLVALKKVFPGNEFSSQHGEAYLVYKNGRTVQL